MLTPLPSDEAFVRIVLADAGIDANESEITQFALDRAHVRTTMDRLYDAPFNDLYAAPRPRPDYEDKNA